MRQVFLGVCTCMMLGSLSCNDDKQEQSNPPDQTVREPDLTGGSSVALTLKILPGIVSNTSAKVPLAEVDGTPIKPITFVPAQLPQEAPDVYHWVPPLL